MGLVAADKLCVCFVLFSVVVAGAVSQHTDTSKNTKPRFKVVMSNTVVWGPHSSVTSSLHNSTDPPQIGINPLKTARGCPCGR